MRLVQYWPKDVADWFAMTGSRAYVRPVIIMQVVRGSRLTRASLWKIMSMMKKISARENKRFHVCMFALNDINLCKTTATIACYFSRKQPRTAKRQASYQTDLSYAQQYWSLKQPHKISRWK